MGLFDDVLFTQMKPGALFINIGRGKIVRLDALERALRSGRVAAAALDDPGCLGARGLSDEDKVVLFNTGSGYKYLDVFAKYWDVEAFAPAPAPKLPASRNIGGIIGPY